MDPRRKAALQGADLVIAALYVDKRGPYFGRPDVDAWDIERDARKYDGPWPVVAHPPCQLWVNFAALNYKRYGGEHNRPGNDGGCFQHALRSVRLFGGVLEHPAFSNAYTEYGLTRPHGGGWSRTPMPGWCEWTCEVWQSAYGHKARKRTWLLYASRWKNPPPELDWSRNPGTHQVGWFDRIKPTLSKSEASKTPPAFAELLISLARRSRMERAA
jgi:hypothetical protein